MFQVEIENIDVKNTGPKGACKYHVRQHNQSLSYAAVLDLWQNNDEFRVWFSGLLRDTPLAAYRWETPPISTTLVDRPFEFVLLDASEFCRRRTDAEAFAEYFTSVDEASVVVFDNLRGDAALVVPTPRTDADVYGHLAAFVRGAPTEQVHELWQVTAESVKQRLGDQPLWLSTAGGGVAWLHVRLDSRPKYYGHAPYRST